MNTAGERVELTAELLAAIESAANATTGGDWKQDGPSIYSASGNVATCGNPHASTLVGFTPSSYADSDSDLAETYANAEYIVAVRPSVVLALVARIRELESEVALGDVYGPPLEQRRPLTRVPS